MLAVIRRQCDALARRETRGELRAAIATILRRHSSRDLSQLGRNLQREGQGFDPAYRDRLTEKVAEHLLGTYERALLLAQQGAFARLIDPVPDSSSAYTAMVLRECEVPPLVHRATR